MFFKKFGEDTKLCSRLLLTSIFVFVFFILGLTSSAFAATEIKKPTASSDPGGATTTNPASAYDKATAGDTTTFSTTNYGQGGSKITLYHSFGVAGQTYTALALKLLYSATAGTDDSYIVDYSISGATNCSDYATRTWSSLVPASRAAVTLQTVSAALSASQNLTQLCIRYSSTKTGSSDNKLFNIYDIWTDGTYTPSNPIPTTTSISPISKTYGDAGFTLTVNGTNFISGSVVNFSGSARATTYVSATQLTAVILASDLNAAGAYNITVFNPTPGGGTSNAQVFTVNKANQATLTVTGLPASAVYQQAGITAGTSGGSGTGAVTFSAGSSTACSINSTSGAVTITSGTGTCSITATKAADANYNSTTSAAVSITISKATQATLTLTGQTVTYPATFASLSATGGSGTGAVTYAITTAGTAGCSIVGSTLSYTSVGTCGVTATKAADTNYNSANSSEATFTINKADQATLTVTGLPTSAVYQQAGITASTSGGSGTGAVTFSAGSSTACSINSTSGAVTITSGTGTCSITATKAADANYNSATSAAVSITISKATQATLTLTGQTVTYPATFASLSATGGSGTGAVTYAITTAGTAGCSIVGSTLSYTSVGTCGVTATKAADTNYNSANSSEATFTINEGALDHFTISTVSAQTAGTSFSIMITAKDVGNNTLNSFTGAVTLSNLLGSINPTTSSSFLAGTLTQSITLTTAGTDSITVTGSGKSGTSNTFAVSAGPVAQFTLSDPGDMYAKTRLGYTVTRKDQFGNLVSSGTTTANLLTTSASSTKKFYNSASAGSEITSIDIADGYSSANFWYYEEEPGTYTITAKASGATDGTDSVIVNPVAVKFVILSATGITVDAPAVITIQAQKPDNSVDFNYQDDVTLNTTGSATGGGLVNIVNGVGTKSISDTVAQTVNLSLTDSQSTGLDVSSTQAIVFAGGATAQFVLSSPATLSAGLRAQYTVARYDQYNNLTTSGDTTVYLYSTSLSASKKFYDAPTNGNVIPSSIIIADGQSSADFWYYDQTPGNYTITASDNSLAPDGNDNINDALDFLQVTAGTVSQLAINDPGDMTAGTRLGYSVTRKDQFGNLVSSGTTTANLLTTSASSTKKFYNSASAGSEITSVDIADGYSSANFWYYDEEPGTYTITAKASGATDGTDSVVVNAAPIVASRFVILDPGNGTVDAPVSVTIQAQDGAGNLDVSYQDDVTLHTTGSATGGGLVNITNGIGTMNISDTAAETVTLTLIDSQTTGLDVSSTKDIIFSTGAVSQFSLDNPGDMSAGTRIKYTVTRKDQFGNLVTSGLTKVYLYGLPSSVDKKFYDSASLGSIISFVNISEGNSSADFWYYDETAGASSVVVSDNATAPDGTAGIDDVSDSVAVSAGPVAKFILNNPGEMAAGTKLNYVVSREDQFGNSVTAGVTLVYLYSSSTGTNKKFYDSAVGGLVVTSIPINDGNSSANFWYYDESAGTWVITVSDSSPIADGSAGVADDADSVIVSNIPIVATRFVILDPGPSQINSPLTVTVQAQDANGNIDTTYQGDITLVASGSATGEGLVNIVNGVGTLQINDAVAETVALSLIDSQATGLNVSSTAQIIFSALSPVFVASSGVVGYTPPVGRVTFSGRAYPGSNLSIAAIKESENIIKQGAAVSDGSFKITFTGLSTGARAFALLIKDKDGRAAQSKVYDLNLLGANSVLEINDIFVSPTIGFPRPTITKGDFLAVVGYATPSSKLEIEVDGQLINENAVAGADGSYKYLYSTASLDFGSHTIRARQIAANGTQSEFSPQKVFFTTNLLVPKTDFNNDGKLNINDWSIFLARWLSTDAAARLLDDLNGDGKIDATDFSIFIRTLKR